LRPTARARRNRGAVTKQAAHHLTTDGRFPGKRGLATRQKLLDSTAGLLTTTPWRSIRVIDIAKSAGTSPATFYQYFENVEKAILVLADELVDGAGDLAGLVVGDWSESAGWSTACKIVDGFMGYWERNRAVFRVVDLATAEGDLRFQSQRVRALNAVTESFARVIALTRSGSRDPDAGAHTSGDDPMAIAATLV